MIIQYDEEKNQKNIRKHGVSFEITSIAFADPSAVVIIFIRIPKTDII